MVGEQVLKIGDQDARRAMLADRLAVYENDWDDLLTTELRKQFVQETFDNIKLMLDTSQNVFRRIVREISMVYKMAGTRTLTDADGNAIESDEWERLETDFNMDALLAEAHRISKAATMAFIRVRHIQSEGRLGLEIITPDQAHVVIGSDNPTRMDGFAYRVAGVDRAGKQITYWVYYTRDRILYVGEDGKQIDPPLGEWEGNYDETNPYGMIPVVPFPCAQHTRSFWRLNWNKDAYRSNLIIGVLNTYMNYLVKTQSFKQVVISGSDVSKELLNAVSDPLYPWVLGQGTTATTLDLNTQLSAIDNVIRGKITSIANNYGISPENFTVSGNLQSGYAIRVANRALEEIREADIALCYIVEKQLFQVIRTVYNTIYEPGLPEDVDMQWNPGEIAYPPAWEEEEQQWRFEMEIGVKNQIDYLIARDPQLDRETAKRHISLICEENKEINPKPSLADALFRNIAANDTGRKQEGQNATDQAGASTN